LINKQPFAIDVAMQRIDEAVQPFPRAALFELADQGYGSPFEQMVACLISVRTYDETTLPVARALFAQAHTPAQVAALTPAEIDAVIQACTFHEAKSRQIHAISQRVASEFGGSLPCDREVLLSFAGVGPKCANLVLGIACGQPWIGVDIHVHRVTNRWGYVSAPTPEKTLLELERKLPRAYWLAINRLLVPFGKHICTGTAPRCSACPVRAMCQQVGVDRHR
jgi:endonuclease-3